MTKEEKIKYLREMRNALLSKANIYSPDFDDAVDEAIKDIEFQTKAGVVIEQLRADRDRLEKALDDIRAEILEEKECAYADFEEYKVEYLGQDWEDVLDSLPQDDFRYGMERCIEIIDEYRRMDE